MPKTYFVTGTDTGVGKTLVTAGLLYAAVHQGFKTAAMKPLAAGCEETPDGLRNDDALQLQAAMTAELSYQQVNPVALKAPLAPHIAAAREGRRLDVDRLAGFCRGTLMSDAVRKADLFFIEGAGGWRVPLNESQSLSELPKALHTPVILVVGVRLGCLNHALLTVEAMRRDGVTIAGWVANQLEGEMLALEDNLATLRAFMPGECLGVVPFMPEASPGAAMQYLRVEPLSSR